MNLQVGDLIPLQGITKADKQKLIEIVNKAEANQSTIKTNIINVLNNKLKTNLKTDSSWIDIQNVINSTTIAKHAEGVFEGPAAASFSLGIDFKPITIILKKDDYLDVWCYPKSTFMNSDLIKVTTYSFGTELSYRYGGGGTINVGGYSWEAWGLA